MSNCKKCHTEKCTCKRPKEVCYKDGCEFEVGAECVIYKPKGGSSFLKCFLGIESKTTLEEILETLDHKLCNAFTVRVDTCTKELLSLSDLEVDHKVLLAKMASYLCTKGDRFVKVSPTDTTSGYLFDKITTGQCVSKRIVRDSNNVEKVEIYLNFECIKNQLELNTCLEVDCGGCSSGAIAIAANTTSICGTNKATLTANTTNECSGVDWYRNNVLIASGTDKTYDASLAGTYHAVCKNNSGTNLALSNTITIVHIGACPCTSDVWTDTGEVRCQNNVSQKEQKNGCNVYRWVSGGNACGGSGCVPVWTPDPVVGILCGGVLNTMLETDEYDPCVLYARNVNQCNDEKTWLIHTGSVDPEFEGCCPCSPDGTFSCSVIGGNKVVFKNSCDTTVGEFTMNTSIASCSGSTRIITASVTPSSMAGYTLEYSLSGATTRPYQYSPVFSGVEQGSHTVSVRVSKSGTSTPCSMTNSVTVPSCDEGGGCTDPAGTITIAANASEVCPGQEVSLTAIPSNCSNVVWFATSGGGSETQVGTGTNIVVTPTVETSYVAKCTNCNPETYTSSPVVIGIKNCDEDPDLYYILSRCSDDQTFYTLVPGSQYDRAEGFGGVIYVYQGYTYSESPLPHIEVTPIPGETLCPGEECTDPVPTISLSVKPGDSAELCPDNPSVEIQMTSNYCGSVTFFFTPEGGSATPLSTGNSVVVTQTTAGYVTASCMSCAGTGTSDPLSISYSSSCEGECTDPTPSITSFTSDKTEIYPGDQTVTFTVTGSGCTAYQILRANLDSDSYEQVYSGISTTFSTTNIGKYKVRCTNCSGSSDDSSIITITEKEMVRYYKVRSCENDQDYYTASDLSDVPSGGRVTSGDGYFYTNLNDPDDFYVPPINLLGPLTEVVGVNGCPDIHTYYQLMLCDTNELYYTEEDLSGLAVGERVVIEGELISVYTGTILNQEGTPPNLVSNISPQGITGCPDEEPGGITYYSVLLCDGEVEGYVSLDLSNADFNQRLYIGSESGYAIYTGNSITQPTEPSPFFTDASIVVGEEGCPE